MLVSPALQRLWWRSVSSRPAWTSLFEAILGCIARPGHILLFFPHLSLYFFFRQHFTLSPSLAWNLLCSSDWPKLGSSSCFSFLTKCWDHKYGQHAWHFLSSYHTLNVWVTCVWYYFSLVLLFAVSSLPSSLPSVWVPQSLQREKMNQSPLQTKEPHPRVCSSAKMQIRPMKRFLFYMRVPNAVKQSFSPACFYSPYCLILTICRFLQPQVCVTEASHTGQMVQQLVVLAAVDWDPGLMTHSHL